MKHEMFDSMEPDDLSTNIQQIFNENLELQMSPETTSLI